MTLGLAASGAQSAIDANEWSHGTTLNVDGDAIVALRQPSMLFHRGRNIPQTRGKNPHTFRRACAFAVLARATASGIPLAVTIDIVPDCSLED